MEFSDVVEGQVGNGWGGSYLVLGATWCKVAHLCEQINHGKDGVIAHPGLGEVCHNFHGNFILGITGNLDGLKWPGMLLVAGLGAGAAVTVLDKHGNIVAHADPLVVMQQDFVCRRCWHDQQLVGSDVAQSFVSLTCQSLGQQGKSSTRTSCAHLPNILPGRCATSWQWAWYVLVVPRRPLLLVGLGHEYTLL